MLGLIKILWTTMGVWVDCSTGGRGSNFVLSSCK